MKTFGSRAEVGHGTAFKTTGGLTKDQLKLDPKDGHWKSIKVQQIAKKNPAFKKWRASLTKAKKELGIGKHEFALAKGKVGRLAHAIYDKKK